jgi:phospholipid transport system substrate-binding protein
MKRRHLASLSIAAAISAGGPLPTIMQTVAAVAPPATAPAASETRRTVESATAEVLGVLRDRQTPLARKSLRASTIVEENIDFPTFARLALGPAWNDMSEVQRGQFLTEFHKLVRSIFIEGIDQYDGQDAVVVEERQEARGDRVVRMRIIDTRGGQRRDAIGVDFRLRRFEDRWKAIDLSIAGVSLAVACRAQVVVFVRDGGVARIIDVLKEKNTRREREEASNRGK